MTEVTIYTRADQSERYRELMPIHAALLARAQSFATVENDEQLASASEFSAQCKASANELDAERLRMTEGARTTIKLINEAFTPKIEELRRAADVSSRGVRTFMIERERQVREAERERQRKLDEAEAEAERARAEAAAAVAAGDAAAAVKVAEAAEAAARVDDAVQEVITHEPADTRRVEGSLGSKSTMVDRWTWRLVDISKVPDSWLVPPEERIDRAKLNKLAGAMKGDAQVPGIEFYNDPVLQARANRGVR